MSPASSCHTISAAVHEWNPAVVCLCWLLAVSCSPTAQARSRFDSWTADTGLPQNIIRAIHQTSDGYLWLATLDGLARLRSRSRRREPARRQARRRCLSLVDKLSKPSTRVRILGGPTIFRRVRIVSYASDGRTGRIPAVLRGPTALRTTPTLASALLHSSSATVRPLERMMIL